MPHWVHVTHPMWRWVRLTHPMWHWGGAERAGAEQGPWPGLVSGNRGSNRDCHSRGNFSALSRCTTGTRSEASTCRRNTAATRCCLSSTSVDGMMLRGYPASCSSTRPDGSQIDGYVRPRSRTKSCATSRAGSRTSRPMTWAPSGAICLLAVSSSGASARQGPHHWPHRLITSALPGKSSIESCLPSCIRSSPASVGAFWRSFSG